MNLLYYFINFQSSKTASIGSKMSDGKSLTFADPLEDLKYLDIDRIGLHESDNFKDTSAKSNELQIYQSKNKVCNHLNTLKFNIFYFYFTVDYPSSLYCLL